MDAQLLSGIRMLSEMCYLGGTLMLKEDKNKFFEVLVEAGFNPNQFRTVEEVRANEQAFVISFLDSPLEYWVRNSRDDFRKYDRSFITFSPAYVSEEYWPEDNWTESLNAILDDFNFWLEQHVKSYIREKKAPDLWEQYNKQRFILEDVSEYYDYEPFTADEKEQVYVAISKLRNYIENSYTLSQEELRVIIQKLGYLEKAVERLNRIDWKGLLISTIIGIGTTLSLDTTSGNALLAFAKSIFQEGLKLLR